MKNSVSCLSTKGIPIIKHLSLNLAVSQNCRLQVHYSQSKKESSIEEIGQTAGIASNVSANGIRGKEQLDLNHKKEKNCT